MVEVEPPKALDYIPETVLKKRKTNDEWVIKRREQAELRKQKNKQNQKLMFKRAEQFIKEFRNKELDLVQMKHRGEKVRRPTSSTLPESRLIFVIRLRGTNDMHLKTRKILNSMSLRRIYNGVFLKANQRTMDMLQMVEPYVTYGYPNLKSVKELIYKKGYGNVDKQMTSLTDNNIIEQVLGKHGILCIEDIVHEIASVGPHFKDVLRFLSPFKLNKPEGGSMVKKKLFKDGGDAGNRETHINELINKMN